MAANVQTIRFRRPEKKDSTPAAKPKNRHGGILQDQLRRSVLGHTEPLSLLVLSGMVGPFCVVIRIAPRVLTWTLV